MSRDRIFPMICMLIMTACAALGSVEWVIVFAAYSVIFARAADS